LLLTVLLCGAAPEPEEPKFGGPLVGEEAPALRLRLSTPCCTPQPLVLTALAGRSGARLQVAGFQTQWPIEMLAGLGTPWNTLRLEGRLQMYSPGLNLLWAEGRGRVQGDLNIEALDMASRLSTLRPLGSYRVALRAPADGEHIGVVLQTLGGELLMQGEGGWSGGRFQFRGEAMAAPGREAALANLLNIIGRRDGERSLLNFG